MIIKYGTRSGETVTFQKSERDAMKRVINLLADYEQHVDNSKADGVADLLEKTAIEIGLLPTKDGAA
jgi:hypothetical protein